MSSASSTTSRLSGQIESYWKLVREDPADFDNWVHLLQSVEQLDDSKTASEAYDGFLKRYPYCYGYWKKYADLERRHGHPDRCVEVYQRGVSAIPLSIDLWLSYLEYYKDHKEGESRERKIRSLYEKAVEAAGLEFRADKLWESYVNWELEGKHYRHVLALYDRLLKIPTHIYAVHFEKFQKFVNDHFPDEILSDSEYSHLFKDVETALKEHNSEMYTVEEVPVDADGNRMVNENGVRGDKDKSGSRSSKFDRRRRRTSSSTHTSDSGHSSDESEQRSRSATSVERRLRNSETIPPSEQQYPSTGHDTPTDLSSVLTAISGMEEASRAGEPVPGSHGEAGTEARTEYRKRLSHEALRMFRLKILDKRRRYHLSTEQEVSKRWNFEEQIKRPYFHVKPLERAQLKNWRAYLDFEITSGNRQRIGVLFERCLIACALYEDIWMKYARYMESVDIQTTREIYQRACYVHLPKKPNPHLAWAAFEERQGCIAEATRILKEFDEEVPGLVVIHLRRLGLLRRQALAAEAAKKQKETSVEASEKNVEKSSRSKSRDASSEGPSLSDVAKNFEIQIKEAPTRRVASFYAIKYARYVARLRNDQRLAEKILLDAVDRDKSNPQLYLQLTELAFHSTPFNEKDVIKALDRALHSGLSDDDKLKFSYRKMEFLEDFGSDIKQTQEHYEWHLKLCKLIGAPTKKRTVSGDDKSEGPNKKPASDEPSSADGTAAVPMAHVAAIPAQPGPQGGTVVSTTMISVPVIPAPPVAAPGYYDYYAGGPHYPPPFSQPYGHQYGSYYYPPPY